MIKAEPGDKRSFPLVTINTDLVITGGGLSGICCAITAARQGLKVALVQDRSVLGGNASSEVRLWVLGATSHMGNNNRWAREGGLVDEILVENTYRNPEGNPIIFDSILLDKVKQEPNIELLLNTVVYDLNKKDDRITAVKAYCSQNQTEYYLKAPLFCDASGDGVVGFLSGAAFRMGAESKQEFNEPFAPTEEYGELLGHSLYFYSKDTGRPVKFIPPAFALQDIKTIPRFRSFNAKEYGCKLWWIEYGGRMDTVHDTEKIKWELWKVVYGVWDYIKNSGNFPESETLTLEWVGMIPGKRESRRFEGDYILKQQDIVEQRQHEDSIAFGGWSIDLHPADGIYSSAPGCNQWHSKGIYPIPYRCIYSKNVKNLFLAGRIISSSHVAFASSRVMATSAYVAQAVAIAAALCKEHQCLPADIINSNKTALLQQELIHTGQFIPDLQLQDTGNKAAQATITASSELKLLELPADGQFLTLNPAAAQMLPFNSGKIPDISFSAYCETDTVLQIELRICSRTGSYTPDTPLAAFQYPLQPGVNQVSVRPDIVLDAEQYIFLVLHKNPAIKVARSSQRITGILSVFNTVNPAVSNYGKQEPPEDIGIDPFEFWCPQRRPAGHNLALTLSEPVNGFTATCIKNGIARPTTQPNAWVADCKDPQPFVSLQWEQPVTIKKMILSFDTDFDHPMESVLMTHPETVMPFCVRDYIIYNDRDEIIYEKTGNYQTRNVLLFEEGITTTRLKIAVQHPSESTPAALFEVLCFE
ncbi:MAG: FAD-dependent oxidoreductase [Niabella sp.]|nr:FAD-dependent oxidoreductase [Niabella sp.]